MSMIFSLNFISRSSVPMRENEKMPLENTSAWCLRNRPKLIWTRNWNTFPSLAVLYSWRALLTSNEYRPWNCLECTTARTINWHVIVLTICESLVASAFILKKLKPLISSCNYTLFIHLWFVPSLTMPALCLLAKTISKLWFSAGWKAGPTE